MDARFRDRSDRWLRVALYDRHDPDASDELLRRHGARALRTLARYLRTPTDHGTAQHTQSFVAGQLVQRLGKKSRPLVESLLRDGELNVRVSLLFALGHEATRAEREQLLPHVLRALRELRRKRGLSPRLRVIGPSLVKGLRQLYGIRGVPAGA